MKYPQPTRQAHQQFCLNEGWTERKSARHKGTHHVNYELDLPDGRVLLTRVSHPVNRETYGTQLWKHILRDQLEVTEAEFWDCVDRQVTPDRGGPPTVSTEAIPVGVVLALVEQFRIPEPEVRAMSKQEAIQRMVECYAAQGSDRGD